jgi:hypothetical protein
MSSRAPPLAYWARPRKPQRRMQKMLADKAVIDLKPFAADAKKRIAAAVGDFAAQGAGLRANVSVDDLRLAGVAYDSKTLRIIANANGSVNVAVSSLALQ